MGPERFEIKIEQARVDVVPAATWLCSAGASLGLLGLIGWISGSTSLTTFVPGLPPMMPNTALGLLCLGLACALGPSEARVASRLIAMLVLAIGAGTLVEYVWGVELRIDQLLLPVDVGPHPGRPSPPTALALAMLAGSVLLNNVRFGRWSGSSELLALAAGIVAFTAILGQIFGAEELYLFSGSAIIGVSLPTALGLLSISAGKLLQLTDAGIMRLVVAPGPGGTMLRRIGLAVLVAPMVLGFVVTRLLAILGLQDIPLVLGVLATSLTVVGMALLAITARSLERSHKALESNRAQTRTLFEQAADGIFVADASGRYIDVNGAGCRILGYRPEEILGKTIMDLLDPREMERFRKHREQIFAGATEVSEWMLRHKDGSYVPIEVSAKLLPDGRWQGLVRDIRERKRAQEELRESRERLELALRGADLAAWDWNIVTGEVIFNARWAEMRGFDLKDVVPHVDTWSSGVHSDDWPRVQAALADHFEGRTPEYETEHRVRTRSGAWLWVLDRGKVFVRDEAGRPVRMAGTELDITERKKLEEALRRSEARASGILSISADAIISIDEAQRIVLYNQGAAKIFGYTSEEAIGAPLEMLMPERFRARHRAYVAHFAEEGPVARHMGTRRAVFGRHKSGEEFAADAAISKLQVDDRLILTVALRDVREQRRAESAQKLLADVGSALTSSLEYDETLDTVAREIVREHAHLCIVDIVEENGDVRRLSVAWSPPYDRGVGGMVTSMSPDKNGMHLMGSVLETRSPAVVHAVSAASIVGDGLGCEDAGQLRGLGLASAVAVPLLARSKLLGAIGLVRFGASQSYRPADVRLAEAVAERAALAIENARLYRAARRAIEARDDVQAIVAHDLRNPLAVILLHASRLQDRGDDPKLRESCTESIKRAVTWMNRLIQDLLDVASIESGHLSMEPARTSPGAIVRQAVELQRALAASAGLELRAEVAADLPDVWVDRERLLQIFENLFGNAIKFTRPGGRVTVGVGPGEGEVVFYVSDTGSGIPPEDVPHLFDRFWRGKERNRQGAGLGLAIVEGIVEMHGGRTWAESEQGLGSTISFAIPTTPPGERPEAPLSARA